MRKESKVDPGLVSVLVVDDALSITKLIHRILKAEGFRVSTALSAEEALDYFGRHPVDIVITDVVMPGMDGFELTRKVLHTSTADVIVMTGHNDDYRYEQFVSIGAADFIQKPFSPEEIVLRVNRVVRERDFQERMNQSRHQVAQLQKLESLGQMAAGIAHEIRSPLQYIAGNLGFVRDMSVKIDTITQALIRVFKAARENKLTPELIEQETADADIRELAVILREIPDALRESEEGVKKISDIIKSVRSYSHPATGTHVPADINECVRDAVSISRNEWKKIAKVVLDLDDTIGNQYFSPGQMTQVLLNLIVNACHAIEEYPRIQGSGMGTITVRTCREDGCVRIDCSDTGPGIPKKDMDRIFDPFFTTKPRGKGTGQGLAIARSIIADRHKGRIEVHTSSNKGTTFTIMLPCSRDDETLNKKGTP